jgi:hypothetical protein
VVFRTPKRAAILFAILSLWAASACLAACSISNCSFAPRQFAAAQPHSSCHGHIPAQKQKNSRECPHAGWMAFDRPSTPSVDPIFAITPEPVLDASATFLPVVFKRAFDSGLAPPLDPDRTIFILRI